MEENNYSDILSETQRLKRIIVEVNNIKDIPEMNKLIPVQYKKQRKKV